ncbi:MAG TPA: DUF3105 domain-containing protein [Nocardioides sp.]
MATSFNKSDKSARRAVIDDVRRQQARAERRKSLTIVGVCVAVAVLIVGAAAFKPIKDWWDLRQFRGVDLGAIGAPASVCGQEITKEANGNQQHVDEGTPLNYTDAPPAFGEHYYQPATMERKLYTADDRPALGTLVHNLEHGYTILWYDETVADDDAQLSELRGIADKLKGTSSGRNKFIAVPWLSTDENGKKFPDNQHIAFTHWSVGGTDAADGAKQVGIWQYCSEVSGEALKSFMLKYPYMDSPEPTAM